MCDDIAIVFIIYGRNGLILHLIRIRSQGDPTMCNKTQTQTIFY